jgi:PAS domain S-box-containing protein
MTAIDQPDHAFDVANESVMVRTMEGRINSWNRSAMDLYGWSKEDAIGSISHELLQTQFPKPLEEIESELVRKGRWEGKLVHTTRDGSRVVVASRWALDTEGHSGVVVEINARSNDRDSDVKPSMKIEDILAKIANIVLGGGALLATLVSFYFLYHYEWTAQRQFTDSISKMINYFVPIGLGVFLLASLGFKPSYKINLALISAAVVVSVFGMELFLELSDSKLSSPRKPAMLNLMEYSTDKKKDAAELTKKFGVEIDTRNAGEVIASLQKTGVDAVPIIVPGQVFIEGPNNSIKSVLKIHGEEVMPLGGIADRFTVLCNENGQWITYKSDKHGFNNPSEAWQSGVVDVAILGDSYAQGFCVPPDRNLGALIRQRYAATLNLAMAGGGPLLELATLKEYLQPLQPKVVLWFYYEGNDLIDLQKERKNKLLMRYLKDNFTQNLVAMQTEIDLALLDDIPRQSALRSSLRARRQANGVGLYDQFLGFVKLGKLRGKLSIANAMPIEEVKNVADLEGPNLDVFRDILAQVKTRVETWGGKIYFIYLPDWPRYSSNELGRVAKQRDSVLALVTSLGISVIDIHPIFQAQTDPLSLFPFREPGHYVEKGHLLVAEEVIRAISSTLSPSNS